ncbi:2-alkenal reductase (NADP(+)-dependent) [Glycine soja]
MAQVRNKQVLLKDYVTGFPKESDMNIVENTITLKLPEGSNEVLLKNLYWSCDPFMRNLMNKPEGPPNSLAHTPGSEEYSLLPSAQILFKIEHTDVPLTYYTGMLAMYSMISIYIVFNYKEQPDLDAALKREGKVVYVEDIAEGLGNFQPWLAILATTMLENKNCLCMCIDIWNLELLAFVIMTSIESYLTNGYLNTKLDLIPGMENFRLKDLPDSIRTTNPNSFMVEFSFEVADNIHRASAIVLNTSDELESGVFSALSTMLPFVYRIGPFLSFLKSKSTEPLGIFRFQSLEGRYRVPTSCRYIWSEWGIGIEIDTNVKREEVEKLVNELMMMVRKGKGMRLKAMELKNKAEEDTRPGGRSYINLDRVINEVLLKIK